MQVTKLLSLTHGQRLNPPSLKTLAELTISNQWSPFLFKDNYRKGDCWISCDLLALDVDDGCTIEEAKEYFKDYKYILTTSKSHQIKKNDKICDRFRVIIPLTETIKDKDIYKNTWYTLANKYPFIDQQCKDFARFYYPGKEIIEIKNEGKKLEPIKEEVESKVVTEYKTRTPLNKGKLSRFTMEFLTWGGEKGHWNNGLYKTAKDFQQQGYSKEEYIERVKAITLNVKNRDLTTEDLNTIDSAYKNDPKYAPRGVNNKLPLIAKSAEELIESGIMEVESERIKGPKMFDATEWGWRKGESMGLIAGSGTGKSSVSMKLLKEIIQNNPDNDDIHFFFTLEMSSRQVLSRWKKLVGYRNNLIKKLYVIDNEQCDERISWQHVVRYVEDTCAVLNKKPGCIIIDHFKALSNKIDLKMSPNFDVSFDMHSGLGNIKNININEMCRLINVVAKRLNAFVIVQNQSTKSRAGDGDLPMGIDAAHGAADFEWFCDYILTVWQPLKKVQDITNLKTTAWQYCKIREIGQYDKVSVYTPYILKFEEATGDLRKLTNVELDEFRRSLELANERRKESKTNNYNNYQDVYEDELQVIEFKREN